MKILITGTAGFIGYHLTKQLIQKGHTVLGIDNINNYYDVELKYNRLADLGLLKEHIVENKSVQSTINPSLSFIKANLEDKDVIFNAFTAFKPDVVCHLAAQAGVRHSFDNPYSYISSNISGFLTILEACRFNPVQHLIYASSSSVYGINGKTPYSVSHHVDHPISLYAATKKSNELMAHTYSHLFQIPCSGLRFFTVYGPWGRPDMALFKFTKNILEHKPIDVYNHGNMSRDFTFIDDIINSIERLLLLPPQANPDWKNDTDDPSTSSAPYRVLNIGNGNPVKLMDFISAIEKELKIKSKINFLPLQPGDVTSTHADTSALEKLIRYKPHTQIEKGIKEFIKWYKAYFN
jgi:UDP-glucuronate 4-epimerase